MGTRHLIAAVIDGDFKLAQYGQWDGYPDGQGVGVLRFLKKSDLGQFKEKLRECTWITQEQIDTVNATEGWQRVYPHLSRDAGSDVLAMIRDSDSPLFLQDTKGFGGDSLMCEWAYVIDFDTNAFEVYEGFNKEPTPADSRFPSGADWLEKTQDYEPVKLVKSYPLDALPKKKKFFKDLMPSDDDIEDEVAA